MVDCRRHDRQSRKTKAMSEKPQKERERERERERNAKWLVWDNAAKAKADQSLAKYFNESRLDSLAKCRLR